MWLLAHGLFDKGRLSFLPYESKAKPQHLDKSRSHLLGIGYPGVEETIGSFDALVDLLPISIDVSLEESQANNAYKRTLPWRSQAAQFYDESSFSIVVDTTYEARDSLFLTPISFKATSKIEAFASLRSA